MKQNIEETRGIMELMNQEMVCVCVCVCVHVCMDVEVSSLLP